MNDRSRQRMRAVNMVIRSTGCGIYALNKMPDALNTLSETIPLIAEAFERIVEQIRVVSSALHGEPVNVIRCENCRYFFIHEELPGSTFCARLCRPMSPDFYCAYGEKARCD